MSGDDIVSTGCLRGVQETVVEPIGAETTWGSEDVAFKRVVGVPETTIFVSRTSRGIGEKLDFGAETFRGSSLSPLVEVVVG